ncbi:MAG: UDP-N-acetylmuramate dehydrogenase [Rikenellaceae bacterium]|nr:UDP-N-acetylmuramate dehydrogenase [Rikenellaceae bacterium]
MVEKQYGVSLKQYNTFGIDVRCECLCGFSSVDDLRALHAEGLFGSQWGVISGGSNILFTGDYHGTLLHPRGDRITETSREGDRVRLHVEAGVVWNDFVDYCVARSLWGAENLAYIPGYVGASPVQNIGAYGAEAADIIESVEVFGTDTGARVVMAREHCAFGYRMSVFKTLLRGKAVITAVNFTLSAVPDPRLGYGDLRDAVESMGGPTLANIRNAVTAIRKAKLPEPAELGNAGSFFKNPVVEEALAQELKKEYPDMPLYPSGQEGRAKLAAGWLIDRCGWKGRSLGPAAVHDRQALVLVNLGGAAGRDILDLAAAVSRDVEERFGVALESEVNVL